MLSESQSYSTLPSLIISQIIKPEYQRFYDDWMREANEREARGLQLIGAIFKHKGRKKFRTKPPSSKLQLESTQDELDFKRAEEMFRKTQTTTYYQSEFGYQQKSLKPQNNIFKYKKCSELELSKPLTELAKLFIDNWVELNDELEFQELVLCCLRSIYSRYQAQLVPITEMKGRFDGKLDWKLSQPVRMDKAGTDLKSYKKTSTMFAGGRQKQKINEEKIRQFEQTDFAKSLKIFKSFKIN